MDRRHVGSSAVMTVGSSPRKYARKLRRIAPQIDRFGIGGSGSNGADSSAGGSVWVTVQRGADRSTAYANVASLPRRAQRHRQREGSDHADRRHGIGGTRSGTSVEPSPESRTKRACKARERLVGP